MNADSATIRAWLGRVHAGSPGRVHVCAKGNWTGDTFDDLDAATAYAVRQDGREGVYLRCTTLRDGAAVTGRGESVDSLALPGLWADLDLDGPGHKSPPSVLSLLPDVEAAKSVVAHLPVPTLWVHSGGGLYPWWLLDKAHVLGDDLIDVEALSSAWHESITRAAADLGWHVGGTGDLARVLRIPGTVNRKEGLERGCRVFEDSGPQYTLAELRAALPAVEPVTSTATSTSSTGSTGVSDNDPFAQPRTAPGPFDVLAEHVRWADLLEPQGYTLGGTDGDGRELWKRPGATSDYSLKAGLLVAVVWSTDAGLPAGKGQKLTRGRLFAHLHHGGDERAAARDLIALAHGEPCSPAASRLPGAVVGALTDAFPAGEAPGPGGDAGPGTTTGPGTGKESTATALVSLALSRYRLGLSADDEPFAVALEGPPIVRALRGGKGSLRAELADAYYATAGKVAAQQALADALLVLEGRAQRGDAERLHLRVAVHDGAHYVDLGDTTGAAVRLRDGKWDVVADTPVLFRRTQLTAALPTPVRGGDLDDLWELLNVTKDDRPLVLAWLVAALLPDVPHPVLALRGEQGSGKSTATRTLSALLDPSPAQVRKPPRDVDGWVTAASGSWVVGIDNVSTVSEWWSDALCRAVTGDGDVRRRLYSDADLSVFSFRRVVLLNGIDLGAVRDDLAERLLTIGLERIGEHGRKLDADIASRWSEAHPRLLGALLDLAADVLHRLPDVHLDRLPRMADFARVLAAVDEALGTNALEAYASQAGDLAADAVDSDPVLSAIVACITEPWNGSAGALLDLIDGDPDSRKPKDWPKDSRALTGLLRRRGPSLRRLGWTFDDLGRGGKDKLVRFTIVPPGPDTPGGRQAGDSDPWRATATPWRATENDDARHRASPRPAETVSSDPKAGDAGDSALPPLLGHLEKDKRGANAPRQDVTPLDGPLTSPASPASPMSPVCGQCRQRAVRPYGEDGDRLCAACRLATEGVSA